MKSSNWMPFYVADYLADTMHLTTEEHGAYMLLILTYWHQERPLPDDDQVLARVTRCHPLRWKRMKSTLGGYFTIFEGQWHHARIDRELKRARELSEKRSMIGRVGGKQTASKRQAIGEAIGQANAEANGEAKAVAKVNPRTKYIVREEILSTAVSDSTPAPARDPTAAALRSEPDLDAKLRRVDEIFPGCGAYLTDIGKLTAWERLGYDWALDVEPTMLTVAGRNPSFVPRALKYFDPAIAEANHARRLGFALPRKKQIGLSPSEIDSIIQRAKEPHQ